MPFKAILLEADHLNGVGTRLEGLADQHPSMSEKLMGVAGSVRNAATLLSVLVTTMTGEKKRSNLQ